MIYAPNRFLIIMCASISACTTLPGPAVVSNPQPLKQARLVHRDRTCRADIESFIECIYRYGDRPSDLAVSRMIERAKQYPADAEFLYWAATCVFQGWAPADADAKAWLRKAADMGYGPARRDIAILLMLDDSEDSGEAIRKIKPFADDGDSKALFFLGGAYARQVNGTSNLDTAEKYLRQSLNAGFAPAALALGVLYKKKKDYKKAEEYYKQAADLAAR